MSGPLRTLWWRAATVVGLALLLGLAYLGEGWWSRASPVAVTVPVLSDEARQGQRVFEARCAACHGVNAAGSAAGPPLVHATYRPAHHADAGFHLAVQRGVRAHHWRFGDMPPQSGLAPEEVRAIVRYVRELQRANGIE